jgi:hypothetical protein
MQNKAQITLDDVNEYELTKTGVLRFKVTPKHNFRMYMMHNPLGYDKEEHLKAIHNIS